MSPLSTTATRRSVVRWLGTGAALAAGRGLAPWSGAARAQAPARSSAAGARLQPVRLSANENPFGAPPAALAAARAALDSAWRYPDEAEDALVGAIARHTGLAPHQILLGNGSSQILQLAADALSGPGTRVVVAEPTFEALGRYARAAGAEVVGVPLTADHRHDLEAMRRAVSEAASGVVYVCNPNNPTATATAPAALADFLARLPASVVALVDEAYHHYAEGAEDYASVLPLLAERPNLLVVRTFSKVYGLAGLRCGYCAGRGELVERLRARQPWDSLNAAALAAAGAALDDDAHVRAARLRNHTTRAWVTAELEREGLRALPSRANFFMVELGRDVGSVIAGLRQRGVAVGRRFAALPTCLRVTVGREEDMHTFLGALRQTLAA